MAITLKVILLKVAYGTKSLQILTDGVHGKIAKAKRKEKNNEEKNINNKSITSPIFFLLRIIFMNLKSQFLQLL